MCFRREDRFKADLSRISSALEQTDDRRMET